jgi:hypothetical protein
MSCRILYDETFVPFNSFEDMRFLNRPSADICPLFLRLRVLFLGMRRSPPRVPVICELFKERCFDIRGLF